MLIVGMFIATHTTARNESEARVCACYSQIYTLYVPYVAFILMFIRLLVLSRHQSGFELVANSTSTARTTCPALKIGMKCFKKPLGNVRC